MFLSRSILLYVCVVGSPQKVKNNGWVRRQLATQMLLFRDIL
jgi:hypothetical protein